METLHPILQALADRLLTPPGEPLRLDATTLGTNSEAVTQLFDEVLFQDFLALTSAQITPNVNDDSLLVSGIAVDPHFNVENMNLLCTFSIVNDSTLSLNVKLTPPTSSNWTFPTSFYELEGTFFQVLSYTSPTFILVTHDYHDTDLNIDVVAGASFYILPTGLDEPLSPISLLANNTPNPLPPFYGPLIEDSFSRQLSLSMPFSSISLDINGIPTIGMSESVLVLSDVHSVQPEYVLTTISVQGNVQIGNVTLPLAIQLPTSVSYWRIGLVSDQQISLPDIAQFLAGITGTDLVTILPDQIVALPDFYVDLFSVAFDITNLQFQALHLGIASDSNLWTLIPDFLALDRIALELDVRRVVQNDGQIRIDTGGTISGIFNIADAVAVTAQIKLPNATNTLTLTTSPNLTIDLDQLTKYVGGVSLQALLPGDIGTIGDFTLASSSLTVDLGMPTLTGFDFNLFSANDWVIIPNRLVIKNIDLAMRVNQPLDEREITGSIRGTIAIGQVDVEVNVSREIPSMDWEMQVRSYAIPLPSLADITTLVNSNLTNYLPDGLGSTRFIIRDLAIDLDLNNTTITQISFVLSAELNWHLYLNQNDQAAFLEFSQVNIGVQRSETDLIGFIKANFQIAGMNLEVFAERTNESWQFNGSTGEGQTIPIGTLANDLASLFGEVNLPSAITDLTIQNLNVSFNTATRDFTFTAEGILPIGDQGDLDIIVTIDIMRQPDETYTKHFGGHIMIGHLQFDLHFVQNNTSDFFLATYTHTDGVEGLKIKELVGYVSSDVANYIPASLEVDLQDVLFAYRRDEMASQFVFGIDIGSGFNLSQLPLVGGAIAPDQTIGVDDLQIIVASGAVTQTMVGQFNGLLPDGITSLPDRMLDEGVNVAATINFGGSMELLNLPVRGGTSTPPAPMPVPDPDPRAIPVTTADNAKWYTLQKSFGPVHFERIGVQYQNSALLFLLDASLAAAGLTLTLDGLGFGASLNPFTPRFDLKGLGIDYRNGPVEIGGAFLRQQVTDGNDTYDEYDGAAVIRTSALALSAIGSYARLEGHPSLFIYAVLDYPLGGPAFFFVTGLAAGFGYNRSLNVPDVGRVANFALVREAVSVSGGATPSSLADTLTNLRNDVPIDIGQNFLAVGIKFTSFKLIDSFVLVTVSFGNRFELDILGLSTLVVPTPLPGETVTPLAEVQMAVKASFIPDEGFLGVSAQLTDASYILSRACHLQGGFAFFAWFSGPNAGDFVQTLGGYHPDFRPPAHYPRVPRLGFNWKVNNELSLKGEAYYALTPSALMAGGHLQGTWHSGRLMACFNAGADFIIAWKPYHYDARANANLLVHYTFSVFGVRKRISVDVGANLHLWGPEFSGTAHIRLSVVSFDIRFGGRARTAQAIDWQAFRASFLPSNDEDIVSLVVAEGLIQELTDETGALAGWIVNPKQFTLATNSVIPIKMSDRAAGPFESNVGIAAMGVQPEDFASTYTITFTDPNDQPVDAIYEPILKDAPAGLWGQQLLPTLNAPALIADTLAGFTIKPAGGPIAGTTMPIDRSQLQFSTTPAQSYDLTPLVFLMAESLDETARRDVIRSELVNETTVTARANLLAALDIGETITLSNNTADVFVMAPQILV